MLGIERNILASTEVLLTYTVEQKFCQEVKNMEQLTGMTKKKGIFIRLSGVFGKNE